MIADTCQVPLILMAASASPAQAAGNLVYANTTYVEDILAAESKEGTRVYAATRGGVEVYSLDTKERVAHYTSAHGLPTLHIRKVSLADDKLVAWTAAQRCVLQDERFHCTEQSAMPNVEPTLAGRMGGARITKTLRHRGHSLVATAGSGLWIGGTDPSRLTPTNQICSNHMMAITSFAGRTFFGSFDQGLCSTEDGVLFRTHPGDFRMVNDLEATPYGLFVASGEGLYRSKDGVTFEKVESVSQRGVNGLAFDGRSLWVTTPGALWRVRIHGGPSNRQYWRPGGARSLQAVSARDGQVWIATEDRGLVKKTGANRFQVFDRAAGLPASWVLDVAIDAEGTAYGATLRDGIVAVNSEGVIEQVDGAPDTWTLFVDAHQHGLSIGTQGGAAEVRGDKTLAMGVLPHPNVHVMARAHGKLYLGTEGGTVVRR